MSPSTDPNFLNTSERWELYLGTSENGLYKITLFFPHPVLSPINFSDGSK